MSENRSDPSEPMWELKDFLGEEAAELTDDEDTNQDASTSQEVPEASGPQYDLEQMMEEGTEASAHGSGKAPGEADRFSRSGVFVVTSVLLAVAVFAYVEVPFGTGSTDRPTPKSVSALSEQEVRSWLEESRKLTSAFSGRDVSIHSSSLLGFSSELSERRELKHVVWNTLVDMPYSSYRSTTRDIGNALKLMDTVSEKNNPYTSSRSLIHRNNQVVKDYRNEIRRLFQRLRTSNRRVQRDTNLNATPQASSSAGAGKSGLR